MLQISSVVSSAVSMQRYSDRMQQTLSGCQGQRSAASTAGVTNLGTSTPVTLVARVSCVLPGWRGRGSWQLFVRLTSNQPLSCIQIGTLQILQLLCTCNMTSFRGYLRLPLRLSSATTLCSIALCSCAATR
jgi:hypothetical protein